MSGLVIKKSKIGEQDLLLGRFTQAQERAGGIYPVSGLTLIKPVLSIEELRTIDPKSFDTSFIRGNDILQEGEHSEEVIVGNNEFYYFDLLSEEDEDIPNIIKSSVTEIGRWKLSKVGQQRIEEKVTTEVAEVTKSISADVLTEVNKILETQVPEAVAEGLLEVKRDGGSYTKEYVYQKGDIVKVIQRTAQGANAGLQLKEFLVKQDTEPNTFPLDNAGSESFGKSTIYSSTAQVNELYYAEVNPLGYSKKSFTVTNDKNYYIYTNGEIPSGRLKVKTYKSGSVTGSFTINFAGSALNDFSISEAIYSSVIRQMPVLVNLGYVFYTGLAIRATEREFGFAVKSTLQCDKIELDYSEMTLLPNTNPIGVTFDSTYCYTPRQGGGSYIPNLGMTYYNMRKPGESATNDSEDFYSFMSGTIAWTHAINIDETLYHQYAATCVLPTMDNNGKFIRNMGENSAGAIGGLQNESLPNIYNDGSIVGEGNSGAGIPTGIMNLLGSYNNPGSLGYKILPESSPFNITYNRGLGTFVNNAGSYFEAASEEISKDLRVPLLGFDASRNNAVYQNGAKVQPDCMTRQDRLQLF